MDKQNEINLKDMTDVEFEKKLRTAVIAKELNDFFDKTPIELTYNHPNGEEEVLPDDFYQVINDITKQAIIPFVAEVLVGLGYRKIPENAVVLTRENAELKERIDELEQLLLVKEINEKLAIAQFAEKLKRKHHEYYPNVPYEEFVKANIVCGDIDEICKEITEGKDET